MTALVGAVPSPLGEAAVGKLIMGSTAQDILLRVPCPVLAVKAD